MTKKGEEEIKQYIRTCLNKSKRPFLMSDTNKGLKVVLLNFGLSYILAELVQLVWGRSSVDYRVPPALDGPLFSLFGAQFPMYRAFMMGVAVLMLVAMGLLLRTRVGLVIRAAGLGPVNCIAHIFPGVEFLVELSCLHSS